MKILPNDGKNIIKRYPSIDTAWKGIKVRRVDISPIRRGKLEKAKDYLFKYAQRYLSEEFIFILSY
jgi:hypothetical protein